jgi:hypothetical protein
MGLFQKASSIAPGKGLLQKSIELLAVKKFEPVVLLNQEEVDRLLANHRTAPPPSNRPHGAETPKIPLTWSDAGVAAPPSRGPMIDAAEIRIMGGKAVADPTEEIISAIFAIPPSVELPAKAFTVLKEKLSISKGALLLYDPVRMVYAPWSACGYDTTTLHRLRIPLGASESFNAAANGKPVVVTGTVGISAYKDYFSSRELAPIERLILVPFISQDKLAAILVVTESEPPFKSETAYLTSLERIAGAASASIQKAREERLRGAEAGFAPTASWQEELRRFLDSPAFQGARVLFVALSTREYCRTLLSYSPDLDPFRLQEDIRFFLQSFSADLGRAFQMEDETYLLAIQDLEKKDLDLFLHQLNAFLGSLFGEFDGGAALGETAIKKVRYFPDEGKNPAEIVEFFSS